MGIVENDIIDSIPSVSDKIWYMEEIAIYIESLKLKLTDAESDDLYCIVDGLTSKMIYKLLSGQCSLQSRLEWDVDRMEKYVEDEIEKMYVILYKYNLI